MTNLPLPYRGRPTLASEESAKARKSMSNSLPITTFVPECFSSSPTVGSANTRTARSDTLHIEIVRVIACASLSTFRSGVEQTPSISTLLTSEGIDYRQHISKSLGGVLQRPQLCYWLPMNPSCTSSCLQRFCSAVSTVLSRCVGARSALYHSILRTRHKKIYPMNYDVWTYGFLPDHLLVLASSNIP